MCLDSNTFICGQGSTNYGCLQEKRPREVTKCCEEDPVFVHSTTLVVLNQTVKLYYEESQAFDFLTLQPPELKAT